MAPPNVLMINACNTVEGDIAMVLLLLKNVDPAALRVCVASIPGGEVLDRVRACPNVEAIVTMPMGGREGGAGARGVRRAMEIASAILKLVRLVQRERIDVILAGDRTVAAHIANLVARLTRRPLVLNAQFPAYPTVNRLNRFVARGARTIIAPTAYLQSVYETCGIPPDRFVRIPNAIQLERYDLGLSGEPVRREFGIPPDADVVVLAGRLTPFKGHEDLIRAAHTILQSRPDVFFLLAGHDTTEAVYYHGPSAMSYHAVLARLIAELGIGHRVILMGHRADLPQVMAAATIVTMPSWAEPFGIVALEGMAMAKAVVATRSGGVPEFIEDGVTGVLVPPRQPAALATALLDLIEHPERAREMGRRARRQVEQRFSAAAYTAAMTGALHQAAAAAS